MTVDPDLPTNATDLKHAPEVAFGGAAFLALCLIVIALGWWHALATLIAVFCYVTPKPLEPPT